MRIRQHVVDGRKTHHLLRGETRQTKSEPCSGDASGTGVASGSNPAKLSMAETATRQDTICLLVAGSSLHCHITNITQIVLRTSYRDCPVAKSRVISFSPWPHRAARCRLMPHDKPLDRNDGNRLATERSTWSIVSHSS